MSGKFPNLIKETRRNSKKTKQFHTQKASILLIEFHLLDSAKPKTSMRDRLSFDEM